MLRLFVLVKWWQFRVGRFRGRRRVGSGVGGAGRAAVG